MRLPPDGFPPRRLVYRWFTELRVAAALHNSALSLFGIRANTPTRRRRPLDRSDNLMKAYRVIERRRQ